MIKSAYIHIPFCNNICSYCDFSKVYYNKSLVDKYLDSLEEEIINTYKGEVLDTIYIGGGTPSSLNLNQLERLFKIISKLKVSNNLEYTIENNFENTTQEKLKLYKKYHINRLSFGLESTNINNLKLLERTLNKSYVETIISNAKKLGFNNINIDLIYALPKESIEVLKKDLDYIISLDIEHISTYSLIIEDNTKLKINNIKNISQDLDYEMYKYICNYLKRYKYNHYEISNFSKKGYKSNHNLTYWNNKEYYGFGLGASSYLGNKRISNTRSINKYLDNNYIKEIEIVDNNSKIEYQILLNLRKKEGISKSEFKKLFNINIDNKYNYKYLVDNNLLIEDDNYLSIPEDKWYISNEIITQLLGSEINE